MRQPQSESSARNTFGRTGTTVAAIAACVCLASCGGGGSSTSTGPAASTPVVTTQSVAVTLSSPLLAGASAQATAVATLSNGTTQAITSGFRSDVPGVATVTDGGLVSAVSPGLANIYVVSGGQQGTKNIRVLPSFAGSWSGSYYITGCTQSGAFAHYDFCSNFTLNTIFPYNMVLSQTVDMVTGVFYLGTLQFSQSSATIDGSGHVVLSGTTWSGSSSIDCTWTLTSSTPGRLAGTVQQVWSSSGVAGQTVVTGTIRDSMKTSGLAPRTDTRFDEILRRWQEIIRR